MENLTIEQLAGLASETAKPSLSFFLPTHRSGQDSPQDPIRFKNLLREAERQLSATGMGPRAVKALLKPAQDLLNDASFWMHQYEGLAVFLSPDGFHEYRLPFQVKEQLIIAQSYYTKPLLPLFMHNGHYYILAISQDEVRLFEGTQHSVGQIDLPEGTPERLEDTLREDGAEKQLQFHTGTAQGGTRDGMFHGHGPGDEEEKVLIEKYLNLVDAGLREVFREQQAPLVLAGVDYLLPLYRKVSEYPHIMPEGITGSPEHVRPEALQKQAWSIVEPYFRGETEKVLEQYQQSASTGRAAAGVEEVVPAAFNGRVDKLLLAIDANVWGTFDPETGAVSLDPAGQGAEANLALLDFAALKTLEQSGMVYALPQDEMPTDAPIAAIFRY